METVIELKETAQAGPKIFGMSYENRAFTLFGLTHEAADAIVKALGAGQVSGAGTGEYARYNVTIPIDRIGVAAYTPERHEYGPGTGYRGPAMIVKTADLTKGVVIIGVRTPVTWMPAGAPQRRY